MFQIRPSYDYLSAQRGTEYIKVRRTSFRVLPADTITVYTARGGTCNAVVADMQRTPSLPAAQHWLACYVVISRAVDVHGFLVLRPATRKELETRPPQYLLDELKRLEQLEDASLPTLLKYTQNTLWSKNWYCFSISMHLEYV